MASLRPLLLVLVAPALAGCGGPSFSEIVDAHREDLGEVHDCGEIEQECRTDLHAAEACLLDALQTCMTAELRLESHTIEGDPIPTVLFVEPGEPDCTITEFVDNSADAYKGDYADHVQHSCDRLTAKEVYDGCIVLVTEDCTTVDEW